MTNRPNPYRSAALASVGLIALGVGAASAVRGGSVPPPTLEQPLLTGLTREFRKVAEAVHPSVVTIEVRGRAPRGVRALTPRGLAPDGEELLRRFFGGELPPGVRGDSLDGSEGDELRRFDPTPRTGSGSGWIWSADGLVVTNHHVVASAEELVVRLSDGRELPAEVVGSDPATDIALVRVDAQGLVPARLAQERVQQGDIVFTFGAPFSITDSMSQGIVSGVGRQTGILGAGGYEHFIQTDAVINPGNSGGPLVDVHGQVVGMNTAIVSANGAFGGIGFAIPIEMIRPVAEQLAASGSVQRGYLGVTIQDDPELVASFGADRGVVVGSVLEDGPAAAAGIRRGDVIQAIAGTRVDDVDALRFTVAEQRPGAKVQVALVRDGAPQELEVTLGRAPEGGGVRAGSIEAAPRRGERAEAAQRLRELGIEGLSASDALDAGGAGVRLDGVRPGSVAAQKGLRAGDVVTAVGGEAVRDIAGLARLLGGGDLTDGVRLSVRGVDGLERYVFLRLGE